MKKLGKWDYRVVRFHGNKAEAEKMQMQAMRALGGFLLTCQEHMEICGPWEMKFDDGTIFNLRQNYDIPIIDIFVPIHAEFEREELIEKERPLKERKEKRETADPIRLSTIVPGFCIVEPKTVRDPSHDDGDIIVCGDETWDAFGLYDRNKDVPYVVEDQIEATPIGPLWAEGLPVISKRGEDNFEDSSEEGDEPEIEDSYLVPGPMPYLGHNIGSANYDYGKEALLASGPLWNGDGTSGFWCSYGSGAHVALFDDTWPEEWWVDEHKHSSHRLFADYNRADAVCLEYWRTTPCCIHRLGTTMHEVRGFCSYGHLFLYYAIATNREESKNDPWYYMGICFGAGWCVDVEKTIEITEGYTGEQTRLRTETHDFWTFVKSIEDEAHSFDVTEGLRNLVYTIEAQRTFVAAPLCPTSRVDTREILGESVHVATNYDGGVVEEFEEVQPWFCLYTRKFYADEATKGYNTWYLKSGPPYDIFTGAPRYYSSDPSQSYWLPSDFLENREAYPYIVDMGGHYYNYGYFADANPNFSATNETINQRLQLIASVMGQDVVIDEKEDSENYIFKTLHSNVFNTEGRPIFMYSYCLIKIEENDGETIEYIKYGYFDTTHERHIESEQYEPAGLHVMQSGRRYDLPYHDVFNSFERYGKYACGLCSAFDLIRQNVYEQEYEMTYMEPDYERQTKG